MVDARPLFDDDAVPDARIVPHARAIIEALGEDPSREGLRRTPQRVANTLRFLLSGYELDVEHVVNGAVYAEAYEEMVVVKDIEVYSLCEHHLLPFYGRAHVAYLPNGKIIGLSKIPRVVDVYARRLQVQERLTTQVADAVQHVLQPHGVAGVIEAVHLCMMMRGVEKQHSSAVTSSMLGCFREELETRNEFLSLIRSKNGNGF